MDHLNEMIHLNENIKNQSVLMTEEEIIDFLDKRLKFSVNEESSDIKFSQMDEDSNLDYHLLNPILYRGVATSDDYFKTDYSDYDRLASNLTAGGKNNNKNLLNLILSNDARFVNFQRRNKSIICTNSRRVASNYTNKGSLYYLFPLYDDFSYIYNQVDMYDISGNPKYIQPYIESLLHLMDFHIMFSDRNYEKYSKLVSVFDEMCLDDEFLDKFYDNIDHMVETSFKNMPMDGSYEGGLVCRVFQDRHFKNFTELIDELFKLPKLHSLFGNINYMDIGNMTQEFWTESPCIMINVKSPIGKKIQQFLH
jgi:hypothetical protein